MKWLYKLEYKYGKYYIHGLMNVIVAGMAVVYFAQMMMPNVNLIYSMPQLNMYGLLHFHWQAVLRGEVWRIFTFIFVPPIGQNLFATLITVYFYYIMGHSLENHWGGFRFNIYYLLGILGAILAGIITGISSNTYLNLSLMLAFATLAPDTTFMLMFFLPVKAKWMALLYAALLAFNIFNSFAISASFGLRLLVSVAFSLLGYFVFFGKTLVSTVQNEIRMYKNRRNWRG